MLANHNRSVDLFSEKNKDGVEAGLRCSYIVQSLCKTACSQEGGLSTLPLQEAQPKAKEPSKQLLLL